MAQINLYQYAEIVRNDGSVERIGSKHKPTTISLTGTGEIYHRVYNDLAAFPETIYDGNISTGTPKFIAVKSSIDVYLGFTDVLASGNNNVVLLKAGVWMFFAGGETTSYLANTDVRVSESAVDIDYMVISAASGTADVEVVVAY